MADDLELPDGAFRRIDEEDDVHFYETPRLVYHIDEHAVAVLTDFYRRVLPEGGVLLDLMSSWVSHLPPEIGYAEIIGHGMNEAELAANPRLGRRLVQDLNKDPHLPLDDNSIDAAMICVSVQYLQRPVAVLREVARAAAPRRPGRHKLLEPLLLDQGRRDLARPRRCGPRAAGRAVFTPCRVRTHRNPSPRALDRGRTRSADRGCRPRPAGLTGFAFVEPSRVLYLRA